MLETLNLNWVLVKGLNLSYPNKEARLFTMDPYYTIMETKTKFLNENPLTKEATVREGLAG